MTSATDYRLLDLRGVIFLCV
ncbi:MAG: hypothetical protein JWL93_480, partial [Hyphomicrobiales bacterium]|nr:hypothetical protein [Hyphomicrobiales bacterium]